MDLVKQMRVFESDHEPDGWPAIQMKQVSALCDEIERLQSIIDEKKSVDRDAIISAIGAQQSPEKTEYVPISYDMKSVFIDGFGLLPIQYPGDQQSPAVEVPRIAEQDDIGAQLYEEMQYAIHPHVVNGLLPRSVIESWELIYAHWLATKDGRITEQDADSIINSAVNFMYETESRHSIDYWLHEEGRTLLAKLNEVNNEKAN